MDENVQHILSQAFPTLSDADRAELAAVAQMRRYAPDVVLCHEGAYEDTFYIIVSGRVEVTKTLAADTELSLKMLEAGDFFGEIALVQEGPRSASVVTRAPSALLEIQREAFRSVLEKSAPMAVRIMLQVAHHLRDADIRTIAGLRAKNEELAEAYAELEHQEQLRSAFLTTVSHELRTPLTAAMGYLQFISSGMVPMEQTPEFLGTVERNLKTVVHLVNNILFLQELDLITPDFEDLEIVPLVEEAVQQRREQAAQSKINLHTHTPAGTSKVSGDATSLGRAFSALLDNAIKFSPDGGEIHVRITEDAGKLRIAIQDPGVGFPPDQVDELFKPFTRIESSAGHMFGGVGLGLPIAKHVINLHGGQLEAESEPGAGSTFTIVLPVRA